MDQDTIFISHATPDDNEFVRWLGARLTGHGYKVWADLFELKGGTPFWSSIEEALRHHACKVIFVVSRRSVDPARTGVRNELSVADTMRKARNDPGFIIPIRIDDTPFGDLPIQVHQLNAIDFSRGWGPKLIELLDTLETANVPKTTEGQVAAFNMWRDASVRTAATVEVGSERVMTNLQRITQLPTHISFFEYEGDNTRVAEALTATGIPYRIFLRLIVAFADASTLQQGLGPTFKVTPRAHVDFEDFLRGTANGLTVPSRDEARNIATFLLRRHIERHLLARGLRPFGTGSAPAYYFPSGLIANDKVPYVDASGRRTNKNVVGRSERHKVHWHLGMKVNVVLGPPALVRFKPYICFSEDGQTAINDPKRTFAIRRRFCKNWWNKQWRQLQQAFTLFLTGGATSPVTLDLDGPEQLVLDGTLLELLAARRMPDDLTTVDEPEDPPEPDDDDEDGGPDEFGTASRELEDAE